MAKPDFSPISSAMSRSASAVTTALNTAGSITYATATTLGQKDGGGLPYLFRLITSLAMISEGFAWSHRAAQSAQIISKAIKPAFGLVGTLATPITEFEETIKSVSAAAKALFSGQITYKKKQKLVINAKEEKISFLTDRSITDSTRLGVAEVTVKAITSSASYLSSVAEAVALYVKLGALDLAPTRVAQVALVGHFSAKIFAIIGTGASVVKVAISGFNFYKATKSKGLSDKNQAGKISAAKQQLIHACLGLVKVALKIAVLVMVSQWGLIFSGTASLAMLGMEIYMVKTKSKAEYVEDVTSQHFPSGLEIQLNEEKETKSEVSASKAFAKSALTLYSQEPPTTIHFVQPQTA